jgi:hypothetical protein
MSRLLQALRDFVDRLFAPRYYESDYDEFWDADGFDESPPDFF